MDPYTDAVVDQANGIGPTVRTTGSLDPLTLDCVITVMRLAPTTKPPGLIDMMLGIIVPATDCGTCFKRGQWTYMATLPQPGEGLELQPWEKVVARIVRFTTPTE